MAKHAGTLTPRQMAFMDAYYEDPRRNAARAYIKAGYTATGKAVKNNASRLLRHPDVQAEMARRNTMIQERHEGSIDTLIAKAEIIRDRAITEQRWRDALAANDQVARLTGAYPAVRESSLLNFRGLLESAIPLDPNDTERICDDAKELQ